MSKRPTASTPHAPHEPWTEKASSGSSTLKCLMTLTDKVKIKPPKMPMMRALCFSTLPQEAVMETSPASSPLAKTVTLSSRSNQIVSMNAVSPPPTAANVVFVLTVAMANVFAPVAPRVDPALNPYQPNHSIRVPSTTRGTLCGLNSPFTSSRTCLNLPMRGFKMMHPTRPNTPPTMCTIPEPAKSAYPNSVRKPPPHVQCTTRGYTKDDRSMVAYR